MYCIFTPDNPKNTSIFLTKQRLLVAGILTIHHMPTKPTAPDTIPKYIREGLHKQDTETLHDIITYTESLIEYRTNLDADDIDVEQGEEVVDVEDSSKGAVVIKKIPCGKDCNGCPHGPYKYLVYREGGDIKWDYQGRYYGD